MAYSGVIRTIRAFADPVTTPMVSRIRGMQISRDFAAGGAGLIQGTVKNKGTPDFPVWRRVRLFTRRDGKLIREAWSDPVTGAYAFRWLDQALRYFVIAHDHTGQYNAEISDDITPELMP